MKLKNIFSKGKVVIVGIGNTMKGDDGFGPALVERLRGKVKIPLIDAGPTPENYAGKIAKENPDTVLLADCADIGRKAGEYELLEGEALLKTGFTTHDISAGMLVEYLKNRTKAEIYMLGVQPRNIALGDEMSEDIKQALRDLTELIVEASNA